MSKMFFERLSALDNSFLIFEKPNTPMHIGSTMIFEAGELARPDGGIDGDAVRDAVGAALPFIPRYRQKIIQVPGSYRWVWVDDSHFNIDYHIRHTALPRPGGDKELKRLAGRIMENHLDRSRPLWEMWVIEGYADGRVVVFSKMHHATVDGVSGANLISHLCALAGKALGDRAANSRARAGDDGDLAFKLHSLPPGLLLAGT